MTRENQRFIEILSVSLRGNTNIIIMIVIGTILILFILYRVISSHTYKYLYLSHLPLNKHEKNKTQQKLSPFFQFFQYFPSFNFAFYD